MRFALLTFVAISLVASAEPPRCAWQLDVEERIARRVDPENIGRRAAAAATTEAAAGHTRTFPFVIEGRVNPELFLPWELFDSLVKIADEPKDVARRRERYAESIAAHGWSPSEFWLQLDAIDASYHALRAENMRRLELLKEPTEMAPLSRELCTARIEALREAESRFGARFHEFLYKTIAPTMSLGSARAPDAETLRWVTGGCR